MRRLRGRRDSLASRRQRRDSIEGGAARPRTAAGRRLRQPALGKPVCPDSGGKKASAIAAPANGGRVFVTGNTSGTVYNTVAYNATTGAQLWVGTYAGPVSEGGIAYGIAVGPAGIVYVTGAAGYFPNFTSYGTVAYAG